MSEENKRKTVWKLAPCSIYEIETIESWLVDMAKEGLMLSEDGFFCSAAKFELGKPKNVQYRLVPLLKKNSILSDENGEPNKEAIDRAQEDGWRFVTKHGDFFVFVADDNIMRVHKKDTDIGSNEQLSITDSAMHIKALKALRKREICSIIYSVLLLITYPVIKMHGRYLLTIINLHTWYFLLGVIIIAWLITGSCKTVFALKKHIKKLQDNDIYNHNVDWRRKQRWHYVNKSMKYFLIISWIVILLRYWSSSVMEDDKISLMEYTEDPPFATMTELAGNNGSYSYESMMNEKKYNSIRNWSDWLASCNIEYREHASIKQSNGTAMTGVLYVDYHAMKNDSLAKEIAREYYKYDIRKDGAELGKELDLDIDYAVAYKDEIGWDTIVLRNKNIVVHATFYQFESGSSIEPAEWIQLMANSIKQ